MKWIKLTAAVLLLSLVLSGCSFRLASSVDELISRITITEIADEDKEAAKEAAIENGEEYVYEPTDYIVAFEAKHDEGEKFARQVLDEVLDVYFAEFLSFFKAFKTGGKIK